MGAQLSYLYSTISYVYPTLKYGTYALSSYLTFLLLRFYIYDRTYEKEPPPKSMSKTVLKKIRGKGKVQESLKTSPKPTVQLSTVKNDTIITGQIWEEILRAGFVYLNQNHEYCNKINVFPVPDGDTGNNMVIGLHTAVRNLSKTDTGTKYKFLMFHPSGCSHYIEDTVNALQNELPEGTIDTMYYADIGGAIAAAGHIDMIGFKFWPAKDAKGRRFKLS